MLDGVIEIFYEYVDLQKRLKKKQYRERTEYFRKINGHYFDEMYEYVEAAEDKNAAMKEISEIICDTAAAKYKKKTLFLGRVLIDLDFHMIYYIFPTILSYEKEYSAEFAEILRETWNEKLGENILSVADYDTLYKSFNEKFLGLF